MSDSTTTSASTMLGGDTTGAATTQTQTGSTTGQTTQTTQQTQQTGNGSAIDWVREWDAADAGIVEKRGWKTPHDLFKSYSELQKTLSNDKIVLPKDGADPKEWDAVFNRLGRPESPDKYVMPEGADESMWKALAPRLHKSGMNQSQVNDVAAGYNEYVQAITAQMQADLRTDFKAAEEQLAKEWGVNQPKEIEIERRTMRALGIDIATVERMAQGGGKGGALLIHRLLGLAGRAISEDEGANMAGDESLGFAGTPNRAAAQLQELKNDKSFMERYQKGDAAAKAKYNNLLKQLSEGGRAKTTVNKPY